MSNTRITRRQALLGLGGLATVGLGSKGCARDNGGSDFLIADAGAGAADLGDAPAPANDLSTPPATGPLAGIESIVVLMMENRSFDHFLGSLKQDATYAQRGVVNGLTGTESNPDPTGAAVPVFKLTDFTPADPSHSWDASHSQWNGGQNDGFVKAHAGASQNEVMGFH